jgi:nucleoside-diphosphate-sugar epimerase
MRFFVTGASGHIGSPLTADLLAGGHEVTGLARSDASAAKLAAAGANICRGTLDDLDVIAAAAAESDGVAHLAFKHDAMMTGDYTSAIDAEMRVTEVFGGALAGTGKPLVIASGTLLLAALGRTGTEADALDIGGRNDAENMVIGFADRGIRSSAVRLPPTVHSSLDLHGFIPILISIARDKGAAGYVGNGANRWPAGHTLDAARLFQLALEAAPAGSRLHAVGDEGVPFREIAETIGRHLGVPAVSIAPEDANEHFGFLGPLVQLDNPTSSALTQELLGWKPEHPGLIADLDEGHYFAQYA